MIERFLGKKVAKIIFPDTNFAMKSQKLLENLLQIIFRKIKCQMYKSNAFFFKWMYEQADWLNSATNTRFDKY